MTRTNKHGFFRAVVSQWKDFKDQQNNNRCEDGFICDAAQGNTAASSRHTSLSEFGEV